MSGELPQKLTIMDHLVCEIVTLDKLKFAKYFPGLECARGCR